MTSSRLPGATPAAAIAVAMLVAVLGFFAPPVVIGDSLVPPFVIHAGATLAAVLALAWTGARTGRPGTAALLGIGVLCVLLVCLHALWSLATTTYTILEPAGPGGCRVIARESSFLMAGEGSAGTVGPHGGPVWLTNDYFVDDGGTPIRDASYELTWGEGGSAVLGIPESYDFDPVEPDLSCR